jgi:hypothetical protein
MIDLFKVKWKVTVCSEGTQCWCRVIEPEIPIVNKDGTTECIIPAGCIETKYAEYLVKVHNKSL